jgi:1,2-diacylglycerol 3-alpha-glucosyltransferase
MKAEKPLISKNPFFRLFTFLFYYLVAVPLLGVFDKAVFGLRVRGREQIKKMRGRGAVIVCNHVHPFDCTFLGLLITPRRAVFTSLERLFHTRVVGPLITCMGSVPVPVAPSRMRRFLEEMTEAVQKGRLACIYPEGELIPYCSHLREFKEGAFTIAVRAQAPVIPVVITEEPRRGVWKCLKRKPCLTITAGEPVFAEEGLPPRRAAHKLHDTVETAMAEMLGNAPASEKVAS